jgi:hypothetical protein
MKVKRGAGSRGERAEGAAREAVGPLRRQASSLGVRGGADPLGQQLDREQRLR